MLSTRAIGVGWLRQSSESGAAEADEAPGSTTTSSIASKDTEDNCSPENASTPNYTRVHFPGWTERRITFNGLLQQHNIHINITHGASGR